MNTWQPRLYVIITHSPQQLLLFQTQTVLTWLQVVSADVGMQLTRLPLNKMAAISADDIFKCIFLNENDIIPIQISLNFFPRSPINNKPALVQVLAWRRIGDKPLPEPMMA